MIRIIVSDVDLLSFIVNELSFVDDQAGRLLVVIMEGHVTKRG